jgi:carbon starvation protein
MHQTPALAGGCSGPANDYYEKPTAGAAVGFLCFGGGSDMITTLWAGIFYDELNGRTVLRAMPIVLGVLAVLAIAYRYYSAFLAARVAVLDDLRATPAHTFNDGQNYHPTNKWVLFGHHFAAISGAGPLIGPVLAIQYGYMPGLLWLVIGVCLAGAVQDFLVLAASLRHGGRSLAEIARAELGRPAAIIVSAAILFIVIVALAGLGIVVVKALGGEEIKLPEGTRIKLAEKMEGEPYSAQEGAPRVFAIAPGAKVIYPRQKETEAVAWGEGFKIKLAGEKGFEEKANTLVLPPETTLQVAGSSWGTFTIACTIPIAMFVGLYMYRIRKGHVFEASLIGAAGVLAATVAGSLIPQSPLRDVFSLTDHQATWALMAYGFIASVLPVWMLLCPRDYLSSFLKIGTIALLVVGLIAANPLLKAPQLNEVFINGGPTFQGSLFPFVFICIMCGAISGFHALVASGTTPKMVNKESDARTIGYGAMLMEGLVGVVALLAAASLDPVTHYFEINTPLSLPPAKQKEYRDALKKLDKDLGSDRLHKVAVLDPHQLPVTERDLAELERLVGGESLRGRTGGAVTLAVGMSVVFTDALHWTGLDVESIVKYWYHFAIMFEALFILTTIDTGTRIARFLLQEALGKIHPQFGKTDWLPGAALATAVVTLGWGVLVLTGSVSTIWPMFGIANQLLSVMALCLVTTWLVNTGRARYAPLTILPMLFVTTTTMTAGCEMILSQFPQRIERGETLTGGLSIAFAVFIITCVMSLLLMAVSRWIAVVAGKVPTRSQE